MTTQADASGARTAASDRGDTPRPQDDIAPPKGDATPSMIVLATMITSAAVTPAWRMREQRQQQ